MTIRPFKIMSINSNTKLEIRNHREERIMCIGWKLPPQFYEKLLSYPITAFGYELGIYIADKYKNINPKFDRHDVIKALDFWIEYWVYENKKDYILEGTVDKDFELTVRELIEFREAVLKLPAKTQFVRQKIRPDTASKNNILEFTENVLQSGNNTASTVEQFCYVVRKMTYKEYMDEKLIQEMNRPYATGILSDIIDRNSRDDGPRFNWQQPVMDNNPTTWRIQASNIGFRVVDSNNNSIATNFRTLRDVQRFVEEARERFLPSEVGSTVPTTEAEQSFNLNRIAITAELNLRTEEDVLTYENMAIHFGPVTTNWGSNELLTVPVILQGLGENRIDMQLYEEGSLRDIDIFDTHHIVQIRPNNSTHDNFLQIDGQTYHTTEIRISHDPRHRSIMFRDLWAESMNFSGRIFQLDFGQQGNGLVRTNLSITFHNNSIVNEFLVSRFRGSGPCSLQMLGNNRVWIGDVNGDEGRGEGDVYTVLEPLEINMH